MTHLGNQRMLWTSLLILLIDTALADKHNFSAATDITLQLTKYYSNDCVQIYRPERPLHEDWTRIHAMMRELTSMNSATTTGIYTFRKYIRRKLTNDHKTSCYSATKVMLGGNNITAEFAEFSRSFETTGALWILILSSKDAVVNFLQVAHLPFDIEIIAVVLSNATADEAELYEAYRVRHDFPMRFKHFGKWSRSAGLKVIPESLYVRRTDLEGITLRTGSIENWPTTTFERVSPEFPTWDGYFSRVWKQLEVLMNASSINLRSVDNMTGARLEDGTWNGLVGMALRGEIDVIVSELTIDKARSRVLDFSHPLLISSYTVYYRRVGYTLEWDAVFKPFGEGIWIAMVVWILSGTVALSMCYYFSLLYGFEHGMEDLYSPTGSFFFMLQSISQQGHHATPRSMACRILFFTSYLVSAILVPSYSASLISSLTDQSPYRPFDSIEELLADGRYHLLAHPSTAEYAYFSQSKDEMLQEVFKKLIQTVPPNLRMRSSAHALNTVCTVPRYAAFGVEVIWNVRMAVVIKPACPVISLTRPVSSVYMSMGMAKGHPFSGLINHHLRKLMDVGVTRRTQRSIWPVSTTIPPQTWAQVQPDEVFQMFAFLGLFIAISLAFMVLERMCHSVRLTSPQSSESACTPAGNKKWFYKIEVYV